MSVKNISAASDEKAPVVMIVDDSRVMRVALKKILNSEFSVVEANNGAEAWELLKSNAEIQLVFTDLSMPELDGFGLLSQIRSSQEERIANLPVIIITGKEDDEETKKQVIANGGNDFISKPFKSTHVLARAHSYVSYCETTSQLKQTREKLITESTTDPRTGLGSERYFKKVAAEVIAQLKRYGGTWVWLQISIDHFKRIYMEHGMQAAETILTKIGQIICSTVREGDHAGSLAPGRFALILRSTDIPGAQVLAERLRKAVERSVFDFSDNATRITSSAAIFSPLINSETNLEAILKEGNDLITAAESAGGNTIILAPPADLPTEEILSVKDAMKLLESGDEKTVHRHRAGLLVQLLPLLKVISTDAKKEFEAFLNALTKKH